MTELARQASEFLLYTAPDGAVRIGVLFRDETAWLTQRALAELFGVKVPAITKHRKNIFGSGELDQAATGSKMEMVQTEGGHEVLREIALYNLDAIIAVGYRVNSYQATRSASGRPTPFASPICQRDLRHRPPRVYCRGRARNRVDVAASRTARDRSHAQGQT
ncbi:MAG: RhuM family protein, partial [Kofleriaceae bacterium]